VRSEMELAAYQQMHGIQQDLGITLNEGFNNQEVSTIVGAALKLAKAMGGSVYFREELGGVSFTKADLGVNLGQGDRHSVKLNRNGGWNDWVVVHELAHSWDAAKNGGLSKKLEKETGGRTIWLRGIIVRFGLSGGDNFQKKGWNNFGYYYGDIPAKGSDRNFNRKEDFAESVATYVFGQERAKGFLKLIYPNVADFHYDDYTATKRWEFVDRLMVR